MSAAGVKRRKRPSASSRRAQRRIGRYLRGRAGDLRARLLLLDMAQEAYRADGLSAAATLAHAEVYLEDRDEYTRNPWPKGMVRLPYTPDPPANLG